MAGNKYDTEFEPWIVDDLKLEFTSLYGEKSIFEGNVDQMIRFLLTLREK